MIGIGGAGMSGIAEVLNSRGHTVSGSDLKESPYTRRLGEAGITVFIGHAAAQVGDAEQVVISTAIPKTNPELLEARRRSIPVIPRAAALAGILEGSRGVAVAGTHGKTTTTSMTAHALRALGDNPTALVGGELNDIGSNVAFGREDLVVAEADESDRSLLQLMPLAAVVTNVEFDHPDFYASLDDVVDTFSRFVAALPEDGHLVTCADDPSCRASPPKPPAPLRPTASRSATSRAEVLSPNSYVLYEDGERRGTVELGVYGRHNVLNSMAAAGISRWLGHDVAGRRSHPQGLRWGASSLPAQGRTRRRPGRRRLRPPPYGALRHARSGARHDARRGTRRRRLPAAPLLAHPQALQGVRGGLRRRRRRPRHGGLRRRRDAAARREREARRGRHLRDPRHTRTSTTSLARTSCRGCCARSRSAKTWSSPSERATSPGPAKSCWNCWGPEIQTARHLLRALGVSVVVGALTTVVVVLVVVPDPAGHRRAGRGGAYVPRI